MFDDYKVVDLTQLIDDTAPIWPGKESHKFTYGIGGNETRTILMFQNCGTHIDAPIHFYKKSEDVSSIPIDKFIAKVCLIDVSQKVNKNSDYAITCDDIYNWEETYGEIMSASVCLAYTNWAKHWGSSLYLNMDADSKMHFPGFSLDAAKYLLLKKISGIGIDTMSVDVGLDSEFPVHREILSKECFHIENLCNLYRLPLKGATLIAAPLKLAGAEEAPARVIAFFK